MPSHSRFSMVASTRSFLAAAFLLVLCTSSALAAEDVVTMQGKIPSRTFDMQVLPPADNPNPGVVVTVDRRGGGGCDNPCYDYITPCKKTRKLWRGFNNVVFGWVEIPKTVFVNFTCMDPFTGFVRGVVFGSAKAVERTGVGTIEVVTFWHEWPKEYMPIIEPEFVLGDLVD